MCPPEGIIKELNANQTNLVVKFVSDIRIGKLEGSNKIAIATLDLLEQIISDVPNANAIELCTFVRAAGKAASSALPHCVTIANMTRRVLRAIRDEHTQHHSQRSISSEGGDSLQRLVLATPARRGIMQASSKDLHAPILEHIAELRTELETTTTSVCQQAREHVHADELILTCGASRLVEQFLKAAVNRRPKVIVAEAGSVRECHAMCSRLAAAGLMVTVVSAAAVCALMSRVNKVVISVKCALGGGAALAEAGLHAVTTAAQYYSVPVITLAPLHKLSPLHARGARDFDCLSSPAAVPYELTLSGVVPVVAPKYDVIPPDHVTLFITNLGGSSPSYIYRLLSELYDPRDYEL